MSEWEGIDEAAIEAAAREAAFLHHRLIAHELRAVGVDADCAPCLDLHQKRTNKKLAKLLHQHQATPCCLKKATTLLHASLASAST